LILRICIPALLFTFLNPAIIEAQSGKSLADTAVISGLLKRARSMSADSAIPIYRQAISIAERDLKQGGPGNYMNAITRKLIKSQLELGLTYYQQLAYGKSLDLYKKALRESIDIGILYISVKATSILARFVLNRAGSRKPWNITGRLLQIM
jgi:tetratricopeptide (TPR) repeat protein